MKIYESKRKKEFYIVDNGVIYFNDEPATTGAIVSSFNHSHTLEQFDRTIRKHGWTLQERAQEPEDVTVWQIAKGDVLKTVFVAAALAALFIGIMAI